MKHQTKHLRNIVILFSLAITCILGNAVLAEEAEYPIVVKPNPEIGKFKLTHDPDKPILGFYGGVGLHKLPDGKWDGYGQTSPEDVKYLIQRCVENGMNRIYASFQEEDYPSQIVTSSSPGGTDYIDLCIRLAHENNIEVYADQAVFAYIKTKNDEFLQNHPNYFTRSVTGALDSHMLSAAYPEVRRYKQAVFMEWVKNYPIDGLQLDFIRFPNYGPDYRIGYCKHGYDEPLLNAFRSLYGYDSTYMPRIDDPRWIRMRAETVSQFIRELREDLNKSGVTLPIGVYNSLVDGRSDSLRNVAQDWRIWEQDHLVDEHSPMIILSAGMTHLTQALQTLFEVKKSHSEILGPIFLAEGFNPDKGDIPTPDMVRDAARRLIKMGCNSLWFCRASEIEQYHLWPVVKEISQWSIKKIRAEKFNPFQENLLKNPGFEKELTGWTIDSKQSIQVVHNPHHTEKNSLQITLSPEHPVTLSQTLSFRLIKHIPIDSLSFECLLRNTQAKYQGSPTITAELLYKNGVSETTTLNLISEGNSWKKNLSIFKAKTDFQDLILSHAKLTVTLPKGTGTIDLDGCDVERDPLLYQNY